METNSRVQDIAAFMYKLAKLFFTTRRNFLWRQIAARRHGTLALQLPAQWVDMTTIFWLKGRMYSHAWLSPNRTVVCCENNHYICNLSKMKSIYM